MNRGSTLLAALCMGSAALVACASVPPPRPVELDPANPSAREAAPLVVSGLTDPGTEQQGTKEHGSGSGSGNVDDSNTSKKAEPAPPAGGHQHQEGVR